MTSYKLSVNLVDVDLITGLQLVFKGSIPGGKKTDDFVEAVAPVKSSANFRVRGDGNRLTGTLSFQSVLPNPRFVDSGVTYNFVDPGQYQIVMRKKKPVKLMAIDLPRTSPVASSPLVASNFPPLQDSFVITSNELLM
jgi:hypothetical protein